MKKWTLILAITSLSIGFMSFQLQQFSQDVSLSGWNQGVQGYIKGVRQQKNNAKPVVALFYTDWCPNCKKLREDILSTPVFKEFAENNLITVRINPETGPMENQLAEEFGVIGYPSFFIIQANSPNAKIIRKTSHISPEEFILQIKEAIKS